MTEREVADVVIYDEGRGRSHGRGVKYNRCRLAAGQIVQVIIAQSLTHLNSSGSPTTLEFVKAHYLLGEQRKERGLPF